MEDENKEQGLIDYKFYCFNGEPKFLYVDVPKGHGDHTSEITFFDINYKRAEFRRTDYKDAKVEPKKPVNFDKMIEFSKLLSKGITFLRVDFYEIDKKLYVGELTFFPTSGHCKFEPAEWDYKLGQLLDLSEVKKNAK